MHQYRHAVITYSGLNKTGLLFIFLGWATYGFSIVDFGSTSVNLLLIVCVIYGVLSVKFKNILSIEVILILSSTMLAIVSAIGGTTELAKIFSHTAQSAIAICTLIYAKNYEWYRNWRYIQSVMLIIVTVIIIYAIYQYVARQMGLPFGFLPITNLQLSSDAGFQRGFSKANLENLGFYRVSSVFPEPSDLGRFMLWGFSMACATRIMRYKIPLAIFSVLGIIISQSLGAYICFFILLAISTWMNRLNLRRILTALCYITIFIGAALTNSLFYNTLVVRSLEMTSLSGSSLLDTARFSDVSYLFSLISERMFFGYGIGSFASVATGRLVSSNLILLLIERGLLGTTFFIIVFIMSFSRGTRNFAINDTTKFAFLILIVELYCFNTFAILYFPMLYVAIGMSFSKNLTDVNNPKIICTNI